MALVLVCYLFAGVFYAAYWFNSYRAGVRAGLRKHGAPADGWPAAFLVVVAALIHVTLWPLLLPRDFRQ